MPIGCDAGAAPLQCLYEDAHLLALHKPAGLLCVPGRGPDKQDCLSARAQALYREALVVHRLDMATSGIVLMARSLEVQRALGLAFEQRRVHKRYEAVVHGEVAAPLHTWHDLHAPIGADWAQRPLRCIAADGKPSHTRWQVIDHQPHAGRPASRLELEPITGRTHQLRVHCLHMGHPIMGDALYTTPELAAASPRLLLHAREIALTHPVSGAALQLHCPAPF